MAQSDESGTMTSGWSKEKSVIQEKTGAPVAIPHSGVVTTVTSPTAVKRASSVFEFRGFDFFANRDFNELKNASRAYFGPQGGSEKHERLPSTWLGDETPTGTPRSSDVGPPPRSSLLPPPLGRQSPPVDRGILGLRRSRFWWLVALVALLLLVAIGVGVGIGVGRRASGNSGDVAASADSVSSSSPTSTSLGPSSSATGTATATASSPTSTSTGSSAGKIDCPAANGTTYQVPGSSKQFLRVCGVDYSGQGAEDLRQVSTETMLDCIKNCAGTAECTGCGWGYIEGDVGAQHTCYLKGNLTKSHEADVNWAFAVLI